MNETVKKDILQKIKEYDHIIVGRHFRPDGDAVGSSNGLAWIIRDSFPGKRVEVINEDYSAYLAFLGDDTTVIPDSEYADALFIAVDTAGVDRLSNKKFGLARELIKIDHHVDISPYGDLSWVEDYRSSACEMIVDFYKTFSDELVLSKKAATFLYTGMVTDSGRFRFSSTKGETMRNAGILLDAGIDLETLQAYLDLEDFDYYKFQAYVLSNMNITENGVAYVFVTKEIQEQFGLSAEQASNSVSYMSGIKGCICWLAFIKNPGENDEIRVRLRSRFMTINKLAEQYGGGGHECAAGATVHSEEELMELVNKADALTKEYKETHTGWM